MAVKYYIYISSDFFDAYKLVGNKIEKKHYQFANFDAPLISEILTADFQKNAKYYIILSGKLYYNLKIKSPFASADSLSRILNNLISDYHITEITKPADENVGAPAKTDAGFNSIIYSILQPDNNALISYIPKPITTIIFNSFRNRKISALTAFHRFLAAYLKLTDSEPPISRLITIDSETENIRYSITIDKLKNIIDVGTTHKSNNPDKFSQLPAGGSTNTNIIEQVQTLEFDNIFNTASIPVLNKISDELDVQPEYSFARQANIFDTIDFKQIFGSFNKTTIAFILLLFAAYGAYLFAVLKNKQSAIDLIKREETKLFKQSFPEITTIVNPKAQASNQVFVNEQKLKLFRENSQLSFDYVNILNIAFDIFKTGNVLVKQINVKNNTILISGEIESLGDLDKIRLSLLGKLPDIKEIKILNSRYKNIITNTGAEFDISLAF